MQHQQGISEARLSSRVGNVEPVIVDSVEGDTIVARSYGDAPEIDGNVLVPGAAGIEPGDFIDVRITGCDSYDLFGERAEQMN